MAATAADQRPEAPPLRHPNWTLAATILASSLAFIDGSVVNVALPAIGHSLGGDASGLQWTINAYMLPLSALLLMGGAAFVFSQPISAIIPPPSAPTTSADPTAAPAAPAGAVVALSLIHI